jgi:signal recognition particle receptor subunit beta
MAVVSACGRENVEATSIYFQVEGVAGSGKTTFIETSTIRFLADIDFGYSIIDEQTHFVLTRPSDTRRFDSEFKTQMRTRGMVIMVDSHALNQVRETIGLIMTIQAHLSLMPSPVPLVIAANKQDQPHALSPEELRIALNIPPEIPVMPCVATDKDSVKRVLLALLDEVLKVRANDKGV